MKKILLLLLILLPILCGCGLTNEEIISETKKCQDAGFYAQSLMSGPGNDITKIQCVEKEIEYTTTKSSAEICVENGGIPIFSGWDGMLKDCKKINQ